MSTSSSEPAESTAQGREEIRDQDDQVLRDRVTQLAESSSDQSQFLSHLGLDFQTRFGAAAVVLKSSAWPQPQIHSTDSTLIGQIDGDVIDVLLATATPMPISCDVPITGEQTHGQPTECPRAFRVEITASPERIVALILYHHHDRPSVLQQVKDLQQLRVLVEATRAVVDSVPTGSAPRVGPPTDLARQTPSLANSQRRALSSFHANLDPSETCYRIANESRRLLSCDRVTVLLPQYSKFRVTSVSGVAVVDRRSNSVRAVEELATAAIVLDKPLVIPDQEPLPPQIQQPLDDYLDAAHVCSALMIPIHAPTMNDDGDVEYQEATRAKRALGVLVVENFSGRIVRTADSRIDTVVNEAALALSNAREHHSVFGLTVWKTLGRIVQATRIPSVIIAVVLIAALLLAAFTYRVEHYVVATGSVEPVSRIDLFAPIQGTVQKLQVRDGQSIAKGDLVMQLENPELETRVETLTGQIQTASGRLASIQAVRLGGGEDPSRSSRLALEESQLAVELRNLRSQQEILNQQLAELSVVSPIDGIVVAWQIERRLMGRPVNRGNLLCSVTDPDGPWTLRLTVPERDAGPIVDAASKNPSLNVRFAVATMPQRSFLGTLDGLSYAARVDESGVRVIDLGATVTAETDNLGRIVGDLRVGADVTAKIDCGERSLIHSWFSDLIQFVHRHILFHIR